MQGLKYMRVVVCCLHRHLLPLRARNREKLFLAWAASSMHREGVCRANIFGKTLAVRTVCRAVIAIVFMQSSPKGNCNAIFVVLSASITTAWAPWSCAYQFEQHS
eukprot:TRINITY_DN24280_c0_g1_i1.p2 TRINITY_DN24280_c0_g1~~TRINITY_DN24280_c0_g1_i1.p2  ORF type:complete len:105 (-),score=1.62 TRINITY_DN24280_c0_g1_i1:188-502(-)